MWVQHVGTNIGWIARADQNLQPPTAKRFAAREFANVNQRPQLQITYDVVPPATRQVPLPGWRLLG